MKAAVLYELNAPLRVCADVEVPALKRGQVLVRLAYSGVCQSQLMEARGKRGPDRFLPHLLGHEGSGIIESVGPDVTKVRPGDRVIIGWIKGQGIDAGGTEYRRGEEVLNAGAVTTFNEYSVVAENRTVVLPDGVPLDVAVLFGCAVLTGVGMVSNTLRPTSGASVAVFGLGGIGLSALMALTPFAPSRVIAVDVSDDKLRIAKQFGATETINARETDPVRAIRELTNGRGVDYSVEAAGHPRTIEQAFNAVRRNGGRCVFASHPAHGSTISLDPFELINGKEIAGSWGGESNPDRDIPLFAELYRRGTLPLETLLTKRYSLDEVNEALNDLEEQRVGRPLIVIDPSIGAPS